MLKHAQYARDFAVPSHCASNRFRHHQEDRLADDKLINDLSRVPNIIASLGLAIAEAQKQFNLAYVNSLVALADTAAKLAGQNGAATAVDGDALRTLLLSLAPARYQFTETELVVKLDLAQSTDISGQAGLGFGFSGVVVNSAFALGYSSDYRAAAECRTQIHAVLPAITRNYSTLLLERAKTLDANSVKLPDRSALDTSILAGRNGSCQETRARRARSHNARPHHQMTRKNLADSARKLSDFVDVIQRQIAGGFGELKEDQPIPDNDPRLAVIYGMFANPKGPLNQMLSLLGGPGVCRTVRPAITTRIPAVPVPRAPTKPASSRSSSSSPRSATPC